MTALPMRAPEGTRTVTAEAQPSDDRSPVAQAEAVLMKSLDGLKAERRRQLADLATTNRTIAKLTGALAGLGVDVED